MSREPFEAMPDVMDAKQLAEALQISKAGAYNLLNSPDFPTLRIGGRKLVMKNELVEWLKSRTNRKGGKTRSRAGKVANQPIGQSKTHSASFGAFLSKNRTTFPIQELGKIYEKQEVL